ncbi:MAG: FAD-dependent thymidylate synthase [Brevinematales bacterium]|nr:FAD-dependent thymidylate synthase [Brevinematales bacterium]
MEVKLIDYSALPLEKLYASFRTCYSQKTPIEIWNDITIGAIPKEKIVSFIEERLKTGHSSPLEQIVFWFAVAGISRSCSHQLVRHHIGISFEQQSQRYVKYKEDKLEFITPKTIKSNPEIYEKYQDVMREITKFYQYALQKGIPAEDARFVLPNATPTNFHILVNFRELQHIADLRLCTRAQWEIRQLVAKMRSEVIKAIPELGKFLQPKCGEYRLGYCDEDYKEYLKCPLSKVRPHKEDLFKIYNDYVKSNQDKSEAKSLTDNEFKVIEERDYPNENELY